MKQSLTLLACSLLTGGMALAEYTPKVVYGDDNRLDVFETKNPLYKTLAAGTAAMIGTNYLDIVGDLATIKGGTLKDEGVCLNEKFINQPNVAMCSGFLVGKDLLLTAGHCVESMSDCDQTYWVFDYSNPDNERATYTVNKKDVYKCTRIVARALDPSTDNDFALVQLDRATDRTPLTFRTKGKIADNAGIVVIGHPSGLPTKVADGAFVRSNNNKYYFQSNLDTFGGNSGSAVFDSLTGTVEGILVRGERDYVYDSTANCYRPKQCKMDECRGEDVTRITNIKELKKLIK